MKYRILFQLLLCACLAVSAGWEKKASMSKGRSELSTAYMDGKLYTAGGIPHNATFPKVINNFSVYTIATNKWEDKANYPMALNHVAMVAHEGKIYGFGGYNGGRYTETGFTKRCFVYTPSKNSWSEIASAPVGISACGGVSYKGKIYIFGGDPNKGYDNAGNKTVYAYDPSADTWTLVNSDMPYGRMHIGAALTGDKVYLSPGRPGSSEKLKYMNDNKIQEFDFTKMDQGSKAWRVMNNMPSPQRTGLVGCWPVINGKLYYIGGESDFGEYKYDDVTEFTPDANGGTFRKVTSYPHKLSGIGPIAVGNKIYVAGGGTKSVRLAELWVLAIGDEVAVDYSIRKANSACNARNAFRLRMPMLNGLDFAPLSQGITASGRAMPSSATRLIQPAILLQRQE